MRRNFYFILLVVTFFIGCGHSQTTQIGLLSFGELENKVIPENVDGPIFQGEDCCKVGGDPYFLSDAVHNALTGTEYDTLVDVEVTNKTGFFVGSNCITVKGKALNSKTIPEEGDKQ